MSITEITIELLKLAFEFLVMFKIVYGLFIETLDYIKSLD